MGSCISTLTAPRKIIETSDGDLKDFCSKYVEDKFLGEGEFGKVKLCHDIQTSKPYAVKELCKGVQFKDNELYAPVKAEILLRECSILRKLKGEHYTLKLINVYETPSSILMVMDYYDGGEMMEWLTNSANDDLKLETISRITFQLLDALAHCDKHNIIHRDIKPGNVMFVTKQNDSELRLVDFGGSLMYENTKENQTEFFGSGFYISPEMFQKSYTSKTDVWSLGVTLYVLIAGFPSDVLQKAFNMLHTKESNRVKKLPNIPNDLPDSFYALLEEMLHYHHKERKPAKDLIEYDFCQLYKRGDNTDQPSQSKISLKHVVRRHLMYLKFLKFERSVTTLLVTMMKENEIDILLKKLEEKVLVSSYSTDENSNENNLKEKEAIQLDIVTVETLILVLKGLRKVSIVQKIEKLPNLTLFQAHAYHTKLITQAMEVRKAVQDKAFETTKTKNQHLSVYAGNVWSAAKGSVRNLKQRRTSSHF